MENYKVKYIIGYPGWDKPETVSVSIGKGAVRIYKPFTSQEILIDAGKITDVSFDAISKRSGSRAATGALIGGVLTGGIGLLAGAAIGAKAKDKSELHIYFQENGMQRHVLLQTKDKTNAIYNGILEANSYAMEHHAEEAAVMTSLEEVKPELNDKPMSEYQRQKQQVQQLREQYSANEPNEKKSVVDAVAAWLIIICVLAFIGFLIFK